ncbi:hypothetical protein BS50DRAFT_198699 [Corynespora cassiicola Philippines]|uniref:Uncharacterized protein n=1 Tax=Corynespora cassiicola Philippines TaxID=1448308 RepID=A0A2T2N6G1_CORCC|nr:hypothetical protein BS50DRAFT_198699 [Corynespora cassiicola Philippines]
MPPLTICPVTEVDRALSPFIHARDETLRIRRTLSKYLTANLRPVNSATQNLHLNHACPHDQSVTSTAPPGLKEIRLAYLGALRARLQAQARHRELQASLEELQHRHVVEAPKENDSEYDNEVTREYIALLRQRRRFAELQVMQDTVEKLLNAHASNGPRDPKMLVKDAIGEQPDLPAERLELLAQSKSDDSLVFKLKREVLESKASMDRATASRAKVQSAHSGNYSLVQQVHALNQARVEVVEWVQGELIKMEEESEFLEDTSPVKRSMPAEQVLDTVNAEVEIQESYSRYTESRSNLIKAYKPIQQASTASTDPANIQDAAATNQPKEASGFTKTIASILPHIPSLTRAAEKERALLQQAVYLQSQIASADEETAECLLRLSGESHLLPSGCKDAMTWAKTANQVNAATQSFVKEKLQESRQEIGSINTIVDLCSLQSKVLGSA